jgi:chromosome partitioning protein
MNNFNHNFKGMLDYVHSDRYYMETQFGGIIFNQVDERSGGPKNNHKEIIDSVKKQHAWYTFYAYVTDGDGITTGALLNLPVFSYKYFSRYRENSQKQSEYLHKVIDEFVVRIK